MFLGILANSYFGNHYEKLGTPEKPVSHIRVLSVGNPAIWPFSHTVLEMSYPGYSLTNRTYGFYSTMSTKDFWLWGWQSHQGQVLSPDLFLVGSKNGTISPGTIDKVIATVDLDYTETMDLLHALEMSERNPGNYSYYNWDDSDNCISWITKLLNPIMKDNYLDCRVSSWLQLELSSMCRMVYKNKSGCMGGAC